MKIYLAADHAGFEAKEKLKAVLLEKGYEVDDKGAFEQNPDDDYPDFVRAAADALGRNGEARAFLFGGSGQGEAMVANRTQGVRAAVYYGGSRDIVTLSRAHNDANALSFGARFIAPEDIVSAALLWLETSFSKEERHVRRIKKIDE